MKIFVFVLSCLLATEVFALPSSACVLACEDMRGMWGYHNCIRQCVYVRPPSEALSRSLIGQPAEKFECDPEIPNCPAGFQCKFSNWGPTSPIFRCQTPNNGHGRRF